MVQQWTVGGAAVDGAAVTQQRAYRAMHITPTLIDAY
jgi:hypothetical protein